MHRNDLSFLKVMFQNNTLEDHNIIIVNQTTRDNKLTSTAENIKVYNVLEKGISKSRNLGLSKATKPLLLIADDDVIYTSNFAQRIVNAYNANQDADALIFQTQTPEGNLFRKYSKGLLNKKALKHSLSIEISFKHSFITKHAITYNELFGLGAQFSDTENVHFLNKIIDKGARVLGSNETIVIHERYSSSDDIASKRLLYARGASFYKRFGILAYAYILKYIFFIWRKGYITFSEINAHTRIIHKGLLDYKSIIKNQKTT